MHSRTIVRVPQVYRVTRSATPAVTRNMSLFSAPYFPRFGGGFPTQDIAPLFRFLDDYTSHAARALDILPAPARAARIIYQPRFDVREFDGAFELRGELPGIDQKDLEIEFTDAQTLVVRGRTDRDSSSNPAPQVVEARQESTAATATEFVVDSDVASTHSSTFHKATVEDEEGVKSSTPGQATPVESVVEEPRNQSTVAASSSPQPQHQSEASSSKYWVSERSMGEFQRTFSFPARIDHDNVKATLKNGILNIVVPKSATPNPRRINIE